MGLRGWREVVQQQMDASGLAPSEQRVAWALFQGKPNIDIGVELDISPQTVKNHLTSIFLKTRTSNRLELLLALLQLEDEPMPVRSRWNVTQQQRREPT